MQRFFVVGILILLFTACTTIQPHITQYKLETKLKTPTATSTMCKQKRVKIVHAFSSDSLVLDAMHYVTGEYKIDTFTQSGWIESPNRAITLQTIKAVDNSQLFKHTSGAKSRVRSDYVLENNIEDFMQYFNKDLKESYVNVIIKSTLIDVKTKKSVAYKRFEKREETLSADANGGVIALNSALSEVLSAEIIWLGEVCK